MPFSDPRRLLGRECVRGSCQAWTRHGLQIGRKGNAAIRVWELAGMRSEMADPPLNPPRLHSRHERRRRSCDGSIDLGSMWDMRWRAASKWAVAWGGERGGGASTDAALYARRRTMKRESGDPATPESQTHAGAGLRSPQLFTHLERLTCGMLVCVRSKSQIVGGGRGGGWRGRGVGRCGGSGELIRGGRAFRSRCCDHRSRGRSRRVRTDPRGLSSRLASSSICDVARGGGVSSRAGDT